ncbi:two-component system, NtrC family, C4-dicarboxylate transport sensor histidine kinase DctB [Noviherbaspirillum humi]|uniref:C4-dicarboxylate transport sensor protein DctB n=1 Tax=Noviherbaspirillum humi TaxID=1688639 RepID=A0A239KLS3_9BURK|nr:ATP-binding protein [Noviherbaspirillum humi]SNT19316.1 two-component system, NtrC family, C4-dicarboxylate transport sensor histidine kinase DctB [Noviherbaspirillum humi]
MFQHRQLPRLILLVLGFAALAGGAGLLAFRYSLAVGMAELQATGRHRLDLYAASLEREIDKYAYFPTTLGLERDVLQLLSAPTPERGEQVSLYLEQLNERAGSLSIYILDRAGRVVATSNWRRADSFLGEELAFRPYFRQAMDGGSGRFFGIGTTRGEPGYYLSSALSDEHGTLGVAVVKVGLKQLEKSWGPVEAPALVADENGVVILASVPSWKFTTIKPLDEATRSAFDRTQQYNRQALHPLGVTELADLQHGARLVRMPAVEPKTVAMFPVAGTFVAQTQALAGTSWHLTVFSSQDQVRGDAISRAAIAGVGAAFLFILMLLLNQRRRHLSDRLAAQAALQRAHDELERKVAERTADLSAANRRLQREVAERTQAERTLRAAQDELVQAGKLAVIGQLAAGVAHELNQPLAALRTLSGNARKFLARGNHDTASGNLERIGDLVDRMGRMTAQLKSFARKSSGQPQAVPLRRALDNALFLLEQKLKQSGAGVSIDLPPQELLAWCDPNRLEQVLVNLAGNALDAMAGLPRPALEIGARSEHGRILLQVRDHGPGLSEEAGRRLFEPFFTTKEAGQGLGLGLAISAGIVADFGGNLSGANHPQGGAVFTLDLPAARDTEHD